jgi:hypothetical protein
LKNIASTFEGILDMMQASQNLLHGILMFNKLAIEKQPRWDNKLNKFLGVCREHRHVTSLEFISENDLAMLWNELESGKIHLSHEVRDHVCHVLEYHLPIMAISQPISNITHFSFIGDCWCNSNLKPIVPTI